MICVLCGSRRARERPGIPVAHCAECYAGIYWRGRAQARQPEPIALPIEIESGAKFSLLRAHAGAAACNTG
jgi:hypothetical protein